MPGAANRVVLVERSTGSAVGTMGQAHYRSLRNQGQPQDASLCVANARFCCICSGCYVSGLEAYASVCVPTHSTVGGSPQQAGEGAGVRDGPHSAGLAEAELVQSSTGADGGSATTSALEPLTASTAPDRDLSHGSRDLPATCLEAVEQFHKVEAFRRRLPATCLEDRKNLLWLSMMGNGKDLNIGVLDKVQILSMRL